MTANWVRVTKGWPEHGDYPVFFATFDGQVVFRASEWDTKSDPLWVLAAFWTPAAPFIPDAPITYLETAYDVRLTPKNGSYGNFNYERRSGKWFILNSMGEIQELGGMPNITESRFEIRKI